MRGLSSISLAFVMAVACISVANATPMYPKGAADLETKLLAQQSADAKAWIKDEAGHEAIGQFLSEDTPRNAARKYGASGSDVSTMAFLVLMEAARFADRNVYTLVNGVQADNASRADVRQQTMRNDNIADARQAQMSGGAQTAQQNQGHAFLPLLSSDGNPIRDARNASAYVPPPSMNLQDAMDRESQIEDLIKAAMTRVPQ